MYLNLDQVEFQRMDMVRVEAIIMHQEVVDFFFYIFLTYNYLIF